MVCLGAEDRRGPLGSSNGDPEEELNRGSRPLFIIIIYYMQNN